jgi:DNA-binding response OmpR family regulator
MRDGMFIRLRKKEYQLLEFLARNKNKVLNRHTLLEYVWNYNVMAMTNTLEVHISSLRRKMDLGYPTKILQTVHGLGYKLCDSPKNGYGQTTREKPPEAAAQASYKS